MIAVADPDIQMGGGGVIQTLRQGGYPVSKKNFSALRVSVWYQNNGGGAGDPAPPLDPPLDRMSLVISVKLLKPQQRGLNYETFYERL